MNNKYLFQFTPTSPYFFGAENRKATDDTANYYLHSFPFPQQSSIVGAVRYFFLKFVCPKTVFDNDTILDKVAASQYIGKQSFDLSGTNFDFGNIKGISEVFLMKNSTPFLPLPYDKWDDSFGELANVENTALYFLPNYDAKKYYEIRFTNGTTKFSFEAIFQQHIQSGNKKANQGDDDEDGFYKQQYYKLAKDWSFAIEIETDLDLSHLSQQMYMQMGGENRLFKIQLSPSHFDRNKVLANEKHSKFVKVVLTSDAYISTQNINQVASFAFIQTKSARNLSSKVAHTTKYRNRATNTDSMQISKLYELIEKGSVFYFANKTDAEVFTTTFLQNDYLNQCGMNQSIILSF